MLANETLFGEKPQPPDEGLASERVRLDRVQYAGQFRAIWSLALPGRHPVWDEYLICLYDLPASGEVPVIRYREDVTHELIVVALAPEVRIDFDRDVFAQSQLIPLMGPNHGYQFTAESDDAALSRARVIVCSVLAGTLSPEDDARERWDMLFDDGVRLVT
ncbi:hypothetical protein [Hyphomicrobium sp.]|uniref:hypothetical protein n=1 Tax=Hyphomicrobium sp. TaxID=82 RepID=UPI001D852783|nr:hypothetical protein [Hyphomicrobium sp.]MBY0559988.1 hypothetical protein [Hyphomicrobium sp.]